MALESILGGMREVEVSLAFQLGVEELATLATRVVAMLSAMMVDHRMAHRATEAALTLATVVPLGKVPLALKEASLMIDVVVIIQRLVLGKSVLALATGQWGQFGSVPQGNVDLEVRAGRRKQRLAMVPLPSMSSTYLWAKLCPQSLTRQRC